MTRRVEAGVTLTGSSSVRAEATVTPYYGVLLAQAARWVEAGQHEIAIIIAQTACEVFTASAFDSMVNKKGGAWIKGTKLIWNYDLSNDRFRELYIALTADNIHQHRMWKVFSDGNRLRNAIIHKGIGANREQSGRFLGSVRVIIAHVQTVLQNMN